MRHCILASPARLAVRTNIHQLYALVFHDEVECFAHVIHFLSMYLRLSVVPAKGLVRENLHQRYQIDTVAKSHA